MAEFNRIVLIPTNEFCDFSDFAGQNFRFFDLQETANGVIENWRKKTTAEKKSLNCIFPVFNQTSFLLRFEIADVIHIGKLT